jgi:hypothetical protein
MRTNTLTSKNFNERSIKELKPGDEIEKVIKILGLPLHATAQKEEDQVSGFSHRIREVSGFEGFPISKIQLQELDIGNKDRVIFTYSLPKQPNSPYFRAYVAFNANIVLDVVYEKYWE